MVAARSPLALCALALACAAAVLAIGHPASALPGLAALCATALAAADPDTHHSHSTHSPRDGINDTLSGNGADEAVATVPPRLTRWRADHSALWKGVKEGGTMGRVTSAARSLLHGCHKAKCARRLPFCPRCKFPKGGSVGHCRKAGKIRSCRRQRAVVASATLLRPDLGPEDDTDTDNIVCYVIGAEDLGVDSSDIAMAVNNASTPSPLAPALAPGPDIADGSTPANAAGAADTDGANGAIKINATTEANDYEFEGEVTVAHADYVDYLDNSYEHVQYGDYDGADDDEDGLDRDITLTCVPESNNGDPGQGHGLCGAWLLAATATCIALSGSLLL
eukprot:jgi/Ulvmu1/3279/UM152_0001.1